MGGFSNFVSDASFNGNVIINKNVGIGTSTPAYPLDVNGILRSFNVSYLFPNIGTSIPTYTNANNSSFGFLSGNYDVGAGECDFFSTWNTTNTKAAFNFYKYISTSPTLLLTILSNGYVGIGTSTPYSKLQVSVPVPTTTGTNVTIATFSGAGGGTNKYSIDFCSLMQSYGPSARISAIDTGAYSSDYVFYTQQYNNSTTSNLIERFRIGNNFTLTTGDSRVTGRLYIGNNDPGGGGGDSAWLEYVQIAGENTTLRINVSNDAADHINLNPSGYVGIKTDSPAYPLDVYGSVIVRDYLRVNGNYALYFETWGGGWYMSDTTYIRAVSDKYIYTGGQVLAGSFNANSDYRLKSNVHQLSKTKTVDLLNPIEYDLSGGKHDMGFLAHEVQEVFPFLVQGEKDGKDMQSLNYNGFIALLVKEVQDLKKENKDLKSRLDAIEKRFM